MERTERGERPKMDKAFSLKGIARHPLARKWLRKRYLDALGSGNEERAKNIRRDMESMGMEVR